MRKIVLFIVLMVSVALFAGEVKKETIKINGLKCQDCVNKVSEALQNIDGVKTVQVSLEKGEAYVEHDGQVKRELLVQAVSRAGFHADAEKMKKMEKKEKMDECTGSSCCSAKTSKDE